MFTREIFYISLAVVSMFLLTLLVTRWGDRHSTLKSFILSLFVHLSLGFGWATVVETMPLDGEETDSEELAQPVQLVDWSDSEPEMRDHSLTWNAAATAPAVFSSRSTRTTEVSVDTSAPERMATEMAALTPVEAAKFPTTEESPVDPQQQQLVANAPNPTAVAVAEAPEISQEQQRTARQEARTSPLRTRRTITRSADSEGDADSSPQSTAQPDPSLMAQLTRPPSLSGPAISSLVPQPDLAAMPTVSRNADFPSVSSSNRVAPVGTPKATPRGLLRGLVLDAETRTPLASSQVRIDQIEGEDIIAVTDERGVYQISTGNLPDHFALSVSRRGYLPVSRNLKRADIEGQVRRLDFTLQRQNELVIAVEQDPKVHHLGNDRFEGNVNSQFQHTAEGANLSIRFTVSSEQLQTQPRRATLSLLAKGVQCPPRIWINGQLIGTNLPESPTDGSFGPTHLPIDPRWLKAGENLVQIAASDCYGDLDDFEFVNLQIHLLAE